MGCGAMRRDPQLAAEGRAAARFPILWWAAGSGGGEVQRVLFGDPTRSKPQVLQRPLSTRGSHVAGPLAPAG